MPRQPHASAKTAREDGFVARLLHWFDDHGRHDLPWQHPRSPYRVWLSEIMLQQTQVATVIPYFQRFLQHFPTLPDLAAASNDAVMAQWAGLGYYARARNLHAAAKRCVELHDGDLPRDFDALHALPGIGRSTAGAILSQAWNDPFAILDGNVKRVLSRYHGIDGFPGLPAIEKQLWAIAEAHVMQVPAGRMADYTQAQMDLGATVCSRAKPACVICPLQDDCVARREGRTAELPTPKPSKTLPEREAVALLLRDAQQRVLLQKRPDTGIWAQLWTLPQADAGSVLQDWFDVHVDGSLEEAEELPVLQHTFSHYKLHLQVLSRQVHGLHVEEPTLRWVASDELHALGLPAPIRKLLDGATIKTPKRNSKKPRNHE
ncbi:MULTISPECIES: A/G-specific adenine glycosylase [Stenotrophomonas]|jgi:A/G-specific adenine glycosylase|uniref:A/G-specific adenine glycosylase n=1 Tax=Stenotrophomonas TaxID=40323 RepID=UPI000F78C44F|nr:A/G-specific adenine glycosylase [Stenotrophomonas maltophilia]MBA0419722.1 A/G-specific adenine glycosylase [Stenotrophomonas maltophilia]MBN4997227.1 A/G-specific adenine glycosylase [Stenotrophomonas maltophilia]MCO7500408.1 A/G-specific adenine glycosylase [Stenotrophomonas maltophilia]RRU79275.1 A/G-specific adenine glycosylase [Stenotrophomonas maltophilia]HEL5028268.1 A/G-specific adenine glycosylase [Stenotrophomonas maltophilia]